MRVNKSNLDLYYMADNGVNAIISEDKTGREFCYGLWNDVLI